MKKTATIIVLAALAAAGCSKKPAEEPFKSATPAATQAAPAQPGAAQAGQTPAGQAPAAVPAAEAKPAAPAVPKIADAPALEGDGHRPTRFMDKQ
jgi:hypothetical protein